MRRLRPHATPPTPRGSACLAVALGGALGAAACAPPPPPVEAPPPVATPQEEAPRATFTSQVGGMNQEAVERAFADFQTSVIHCLERGEHEGLGGELTLHLRVALDGRTRWAHIDRSTMGSRDVERCIMAEAEARRWPKPKGGEGKADHTYVVDPAVAVEVWEAKRLRPAMPAIVREVAKCLEGRRDRFQATIYFGRDGRVMSAGVASPRREVEERADCIAEVLGELELGRQRAALTKVTFKVP